MKRGKYRRIQQKKLRERINLMTNYSDYPLSPAQERALLNRGLNFCPQPTAVNRTKVEAGLKRMARAICWADFFQGKDSDGGEVRPVSLIKEKKTNFPPTTGENKYVPSRGRGGEGVHHLHPRRHCVRPPQTIPLNKMGGQSVMNTVDYVGKVEKMLKATFCEQHPARDRLEGYKPRQGGGGRGGWHRG